MAACLFDKLFYRSKYLRAACFFYFCFYTYIAHAQNDTAGETAPRQRSYTLNFHYGSIYAHSIDIKNTADARPGGFSFEMANRSVDAATWNKYGCYPSSGFMFAYLDLNTSVLGKSYTAAYIFEPTFRLNSKMDLFIKTRVGLSYLTNPNDSIKNPDNKTYSSSVNFFSAAGIGVTCKINDHYSAVVAGNFFHNSNGGFEQPNRGLNYPHVSLGLRYSVKSNASPLYKRIKDTTWKMNRTRYDVFMYYSPKEGYNAGWRNRRKFVLGAGGQIVYRLSNINALTTGAEIYYDAGIKTIKQNLGDNSSNVFAGVTIGNEFIFRKIIFSQQLGFYLYRNTETYRELYLQPFGLIYHRWGLRYKLKEHWYVGGNFLVHGHVADYIDGRLTYRF
jgi:hypothetical protein